MTEYYKVMAGRGGSSFDKFVEHGFIGVKL